MVLKVTKSASSFLNSNCKPKGNFNSIEKGVALPGVDVVVQGWSPEAKHPIGTLRCHSLNSIPSQLNTLSRVNVYWLLWVTKLQGKEIVGSVFGEGVDD